MKRWSISLSLFLSLLAAAQAEAADLRVDAANGDDTATYAEVAAGTASWATIGRAAWGSTDRNNPNAAEAAQQGDTVIVAAGTYSAANMSGTRYEPAWNPVNGADSASEADRITFRAEGLVELRGQVDDGGPIIGTSGRNYIRWQGFYIDEQYVDSRPDTGPVVVWGSDYGEIVDCTIIGDPDPLLHYDGAWDNHNGIRIEAANHAVIRGNYISGFNHMGNGDPGRNAAGIMMYDSRHILIENNELTDNCTGAYIKGSAQNGQTQEDVTVRFNLVHDNTERGMQLMGIEGERSRVYQNVVYGNPTGVLIQHQNDTSIPHNLDFINNTVANNSTGIMYRIDGMPPGNRYHNNIVTDGDVGFMSEGTDFTHLDSQHHCLFGLAAAANIAFEDHTLAEWIADTGQEQAPPATIEQDPLYQDAANDDYRLQSTSPCREIGVDVLDLDGDGATDDLIPAGAYVGGSEVIGPDGGGGPVGGSGGAGAAGGTGTGGGATGGSAGAGGTGDAADLASEDTSGCGCKVASPISPAGGRWLALMIGLGFARRRRDRSGG